MTPRWLVGFSDVTALLAAAHRLARVQTIHGPMVCQLGRRGQAAFEPLRRTLEGERPPPVTGLKPLVAGRAEGWLAGGNLTVLSHLVGTPWMPSFEGAVLFLEDVGERPYRLDRCLVHLAQAGVLEGIRGVVIGDLTACEAQGGEASAEEVLSRFCEDLGAPAVMGVPAGHGPVNRPLVFGAEVEIDAGLGVLRWI